MKRFNPAVLCVVFLLLLLSVHKQAFAQHWLGYANSRYAGTNGMYLNPATMANNRYNFYMNLVGFNANFYNDYVQLNTPYSPWRVALNSVPEEFKDSNGSAMWNDSYLKENLNGRNKNISFMTEVRGPSLLFSIGYKHTIAIGTRARVGVQLLDMNEDLARIFRWGTGLSGPAFSGIDSLSYNKLYNQKNFAMNVNAFTEYSFSYSTLVYEKKESALKAGITLKRLTGLYSAYFQNQAGGGVIVYDADSIGLVNVDAQYGYVNENYYTDKNNPASFSRLFSKDKLGSGWGLDIGFAYEYRPNAKTYRYTMDKVKRYDRSSVKHKYRIAAALTDLGSINYNNTKWVGARVLPENTTVDLGHTDTLKKMFDDFGQEGANLNGFDRMNTYIEQLTGFKESKNSFKSKLPTTLNLQADYNIVRNIFINFTWVQSLRRKDAIGMRHFTQLSFTPRVESKWFEASMPIVINNDMRSFNFGLFFRVGPFFMGSDRIGSLIFNTRNLYGMDFYTGLCIPIAYKKPRDKDLDMVSDKFDMCPDSAGTVKLKGCPDKDNDGVADSDDNCPELAGTKATKGCPDTDGDKVLDDADKCPDVPGKAEYNGCPDTDGDGVIDTADKCPDIKGAAQMAGCPDKDSDGVADNEDNCPDVKGIKVNKGCPAESKPDKPQKDTVVAKKPVVPKLPSNEDQVLKEVFENLNFETSSAVIKDESFESLDKLARLLLAKTSYLVSIEGHTDNQGDAAANLSLSRRRAEAVKKYLVDKGVDAKRLFAEGYGESRPVATNATPEGRRRNRRVEFLIMRVND